MIHNTILSAAACVIALAASSLSIRAELKPEDIYSAVSPSVISLDVENAAGRRFVGSGFLALGNGLAVTAWHVVYDARRVEARFADGQRVKVLGVVDKNEALDLALIKLDTDRRPRLKLKAATPRIGSRVYIIGSPRGYDFSIGEGLISQIRTVDGVRYYQLSCPISPGDSGGPVLNAQGEAIGVVSWRKADAESVGFAIPGPAVVQMDPSLPVVAWAEGAPAAPPSGKPSGPGPMVRAHSPAEAQGLPGSYPDFVQFLSGHAGQRVSVVVQGPRGKESRFDFEVPKEAVKTKATAK